MSGTKIEKRQTQVRRHKTKTGVRQRQERHKDRSETKTGKTKRGLTQRKQ